MTQRRNIRGTPADFVVAGEFPHTATFAPDAPAAALWAAQVAVTLAGALDGQPIAPFARKAGLARSTIYDIMAGRTWPDFVSLVKLTETLGVPLWPAGPHGRRATAGTPG